MLVFSAKSKSHQRLINDVTLSKNLRNLLVVSPSTAMLWFMATALACAQASAALAAAPSPPRTGILVHGFHCGADEWEKVVWGEPPYRLGRVPTALLAAHHAGDACACILFGSGASTHPESGLVEAEVKI